jgi:hypothetical protein
VKSYVFDTRMTTNIGNEYGKGMHLYWPFGLMNNWQYDGQAFTVLEIPPLIQIRMHPFGLGRGWGTLTIDAGRPLFKFPMPQRMKDEYDSHKFYFEGRRFILDVRIHMENE